MAFMTPFNTRLSHHSVSNFMFFAVIFFLLFKSLPISPSEIKMHQGVPSI